jgi:hypothetical protein
MPAKRVKKAPKATPNAPRDDEAIYSPTPLSLPLHSLPSLVTPNEPVLTADPTTDALMTEPTIELTTELTTEPTAELTRPTIELSPEPANDTKATVLKWTAEMIEALVECIYGVWKDGRASDNGFKKEVWVEASNAVQRVYRGLPLTIEWEKCKNKWTDLKEKWKHWLVLSDQSGFGWNDDTERYEAADYVWDNLNKSHPRIIWHKTHVMPHREILGEILHEAQATGKGAVSMHAFDSTSSIDPRLLSLSRIPSAITSPSTSPVPGLYNKSKKRAKVEISDDEDGVKATSTHKKVDLGYAITSLSIEMAKSRKLREDHKSDQEKAVQLLEKEYGDRLDTMVFINACAFFEDEHKARSFLAISNIERRDRWLEVNLFTELILD